MVKIPDKMFFRIGDVSRITGVKSYVLRYWESEFKFLKPIKNRAGQRVYRRKDVETILEIKRLLYDEKFTIAGAKRRVEELRRAKPDAPESDQAPHLAALLKVVHSELSQLHDLLK
jgi:DNA-binding transcriptional MerR regulator